MPLIQSNQHVKVAYFGVANSGFLQEQYLKIENKWKLMNPTIWVHYMKLVAYPYKEKITSKDCTICCLHIPMGYNLGKKNCREVLNCSWQRYRHSITYGIFLFKINWTKPNDVSRAIILQEMQRMEKKLDDIMKKQSATSKMWDIQR